MRDIFEQNKNLGEMNLMELLTHIHQSTALPAGMMPNQDPSAFGVGGNQLPGGNLMLPQQPAAALPWVAHRTTFHAPL